MSSDKRPSGWNSKSANRRHQVQKDPRQEKDPLRTIEEKATYLTHLELHGKDWGKIERGNLIKIK